MISNKAKWALLIGLFLVVALCVLVLGFYLAGFDIIGWFSSKYAFIVYVTLGAYLLFAASLAVYDWVRK